MPTEWASAFDLLFVLYCRIYKKAADANKFAAACHHSRFIVINRQRQEAYRAVTKMAVLGLLEQNFIMQFSHSLLTSFFMLRSMIPLTTNAAISYEHARAFLKFYVVIFGDAAGRATHHVDVGVGLCIYIYIYIYIYAHRTLLFCYLLLHTRRDE